MNPGKCIRSCGVLVLGLVCALAGTSRSHAQRMQLAGSAASIPSSSLIQPQELNRILHEKESALTVILQVGSRVMFDEAHIPGSKYAGPGSQEAGLSLLRRTVAGLGHDTPVVIYCGCCPWTRCPNIWPAYKKLVGMGFTHVQALYLADNFGTDWANKGYPVEGSH